MASGGYTFELLATTEIFLAGKLLHLFASAPGVSGGR
jgi:hypothetical protein